MSTEAMKLALEALENSVDLVREDAYQAEKLYGNYPTRQGKVNGLKVLADDHEKAITALREALNASLAEQPAPPPECQTEAEKTAFAFGWFKALESVRQQPAQRTWVGLTDEDIRQCSRDVVAGGPENSVDRFAYAIETKLKEKNNAM